MPPAAKMNDMVMQTPPAHCHMLPGHPTPGGPVPVPVPSAPPLQLMLNTSLTVMVMNQPAATLGTQTPPCVLPGCIPSGPGVVAKGSMTVQINSKPAARVMDMTNHTGCVGCVPAPTGQITGPGAPTVMIGG